jgi:hypothetical protein
MSCTDAPIGAVVTPGGLQGARLRQGPPPAVQFRKIRSSFLLHALIIGEIGWVFGYICRVTDLEAEAVKAWSATTSYVATVRRRWALRRLTRNYM